MLEKAFVTELTRGNSLTGQEDQVKDIKQEFDISKVELVFENEFFNS